MIPPGWYPSPHYVGFTQWWNGQAWTPDFLPVNAPSPVQGRVNRNVKPQLKTRTVLRLVGAFLLLLSALPILGTFSDLSPVIFGQQREATGTVVGTYVTSTTPEGNPATCIARASFRVDGVGHVAESQDGSYSYCNWKMGQHVNINYDPQNPSGTGVVDIDSPTLALLWSTLAGGVTELIAGVGVLAASFFVKERTK